MYGCMTAINAEEVCQCSCMTADCGCRGSPCMAVSAMEVEEVCQCSCLTTDYGRRGSPYVAVCQL